MHGIGNVLAPCGGVNDTDDIDVRRGDDETFWLVNAITGSPVWKQGRNALFVVFDEGNGPLTCPGYNPDTGTAVVAGTLLPGPDCYNPGNFNDKVVMIVITNYGKRGLVDHRFYDHFSLLKTIEAAFDLPFLGRARDPRTHTLAPLLRAEDE
jgi:phospholipase C